MHHTPHDSLDAERRSTWHPLPPREKMIVWLLLCEYIAFIRIMMRRKRKSNNTSQAVLLLTSPSAIEHQCFNYPHSSSWKKDVRYLLRPLVVLILCERQVRASEDSCSVNRETCCHRCNQLIQQCTFAKAVSVVENMFSHLSYV